MIASLLISFAMIGIAAGLFGFYLARLLLVDGLSADAAETNHNARLLLLVSVLLMAVSLGAGG